MWRNLLCLSFLFLFVTAPAKPVEMLFSLSGKTALLQYKLKNQFKVTINGFSNEVIYFSDRPIREAGLINVHDFLTIWYKPSKTSFANMAPNIVLHGKNQQAQILNYVFVMSHPRYNASQQQLTFTAHPFGKQKLPLSLKLNSVAVFIDGYWGGGLG